MTLSVDNTYKVMGAYKEPTFTFQFTALEIENYVDKRITNPDLANILKGYGKRVDISNYPTSLTKIFADELEAYKCARFSSKGKKNELIFSKSIENYAEFFLLNFERKQAFEAIFISMLRVAGIVPIPSYFNKLVFRKLVGLMDDYKELLKTEYKWTSENKSGEVLS